MTRDTMTSFTLREMHPEDGPAVAALMHNDLEAPRRATTTRFLVDPYQAWKTLKPNMIGVVAESAEVDWLVGVGTVSFATVQLEGALYSAAYLENLKVHHAFRGQGLGTQLAEWRVARARQQFGGPGVIISSTTRDNTASLTTMRKWATQFLGPVALAPAVPRSTPPDAGDLGDLTVRSAEPADLATIAERANAFYADYNLYEPQSAERLGRLLDGESSVYQYRVAVRGGRLVAGILLSERGRLMVDEFRKPPVERALTLLEAGALWYDEHAAAQYLWQWVRWEFRDRVTNLSCNFDPRSPMQQVLQSADGPRARILITLAVNGPVAADPNALLFQPVRG